MPVRFWPEFSVGKDSEHGALSPTDAAADTVWTAVCFQ